MARHGRTLPATGSLQFEGLFVEVRAGDSVWSALWRAGVLGLRTTRTGAQRGSFCGIGVCHECLISVGDLVNARACLIPATDGMVATRTDWGDVAGPDDAET